MQFTPQRIVVVNSLLFVLVMTLAVMLLTRERLLPGPPPVDDVRDEVAELIEQRESARDRLEGELKALGEKDIFATIIPMPTPTPTPTPTPVPPPDISNVTSDWRLEIILPRSQMARFESESGDDIWDLHPGESRRERDDGRDVDVYLDAVDTTEFSATVRIEWEGEAQTRTFRMFD